MKMFHNLNNTYLLPIKQYQFIDTNFNPGVPFPEMNAPAAHIHQKPNAEPYARHTLVPIPVPDH